MRRRILVILCGAVAATATGPLGSANAAQLSFKSPSGNIVCLMSADSRNSLAQCWVLSARCYNREIGQTVSYTYAFDGSRRPSRFCPGDFVPARRVLGYGRSIRLGNVRCASEVKGVTCTHLKRRWGMFLSRERQRFF
jgi:hypothetical protein